MESGESTTGRLKPDDASILPPPPRKPPPRRSRAARICCVLLSLLTLLVILVAVVVALTAFKPRAPTTKLVSASVAGVSPRLSLPAVRVELNVTLDLDLLVGNPNRVAFSHDDGRSKLYYRGAQVGDADVAPGRIPSRGSAHVYTRVTLEADRFAADLGSLGGDVLAGRLALDSSTRIPGRVVLLGFIKRHVVAASDCHFVIGFPGVQLLQQQCRHWTKM